MNRNILDLLKKDLQRHKVAVCLPGRDDECQLYLIEVTALTSKFDELRLIYRTKMNALRSKLAEKIFGRGETSSVFGVFLDDDCRMVFAFNRDFADYNKETKMVVFKDIDDILLGRLDEIEAEPTPHTPMVIERPPSGGGFDGGSAVFRYSLVEKGI
ncbi:MAG TPA: hypothetical protein PKY08_02410 [Candidatus Magasanikbacteria bacterium]|nr:hypothetical protein [Candidatus Magasanikbacteria bacterium]